MEYKNTLNLPTTEFPMKANLAQREPEILKHWMEINLYETLRQQRQGKEKYIFNDGPPYANGNIHIGHALNKTLKDIIVKSKNLSGFDAPFVPGWDCHGLPIELNVEKKIGKAGKDVSPEGFRKACREYAASQIDIQRSEFKRLGVIADWDHPYLTMDFTYEANIIRALAKILENGFVVQGFKPVHWCIDCGSALAEAELEYASKISPAIDVRFPVVDEKEFLKRFDIKNIGEGIISVPIWTTTPWSLPANEAVALGPDLDYVLVQVNSNTFDSNSSLQTDSSNPSLRAQRSNPERLLIVAQLLETCLKRYGVESFQELARVKGKVLEGILLQHPFYERKVPIILGDHVTTETGTGAISTAPAHGPEDYIIGQKYRLPVVNPIGSNGCFLPDVPLFGGEHIRKVEPHIIAVLEERGNLIYTEKVEHSYPHCWRHKTPLILLATPQWFVALHKENEETNELSEAAVAATKTVKWLPKWGEANIVGMVTNRPDWCISRQRNWGTPIPILVHKHTRKPHPNTAAIMKKVADKVAQQGMESWFQSTPADWIGKEGEDYEKINDILDVWFDAGVEQFTVLQQRADLKYPANVVLEGSDQYRGWFQSLLLTAIAMQVKANDKSPRAEAPYKTVITHGFTVDEKGRKMSKSIGNVIAPEKVWNTLGADILRLWVASTDYTGEVAISDEILKRLSEAYRRIRNTARYFLSNLFDFDPQQHLVAPEKMLSLDRWAVDRAHLLQTQITKAYDEFNYHEIYQLVHNFCIVEMGGFYLDIIKDRQYTTAKNSLARRSAQTAMFHIAEAMVRWLAPILSFTCDEIWQFLPGKREQSVFLTTWYEELKTTEKNDPLANFNRRDYWELLMNIRAAVNKEIEKIRDEGQVGSSLEAEVEIFCSPNSKLFKALTALENELRFVFITSLAKISPAAEAPADTAVAIIAGEELWIKVHASNNPKCVRCWHRRADVGSDPEHPEICARCVENVIGSGEVRMFA